MSFHIIIHTLLVHSHNESMNNMCHAPSHDQTWRHQKHGSRKCDWTL